MVQVPPAASIFSRAVFEKACAWTVSFFFSSPWPRILTGTSLRVARRLSARAPGLTSAPSSKRASRSARFTGCVWVRKASNGIDFFMCGPRSLRIRMWIGFWPPSNRARFVAPEREPQPFWPRPAVLPVPEPSPRPTRLRGRRDPGAGFRLCNPIRSESAILGDLHEVRHLRDHAPRLRRVGDLNLLPDPPQPERPQRRNLPLVAAVPRPRLRDRNRAHEGSSVAGASSLTADGSSPDTRVVDGTVPFPFPSAVSADESFVVNPSTWLIDSPRNSATSS